MDQSQVAGQGVRLTVGGVIVSEQANRDTDGAPNSATIPLSAIVPAGNTYSVASFGAVSAFFALRQWAELR
jgi:hypothetical protein